uniref:Uncharacterized protein n=1 Tax=Globodera rostochiensis TaxID=31243 RepID=A0A914IDT0_GLORO
MPIIRRFGGAETVKCQQQKNEKLEKYQKEQQLPANIRGEAWPALFTMPSKQQKLRKKKTERYQRRADQSVSPGSSHIPDSPLDFNGSANGNEGTFLGNTPKMSALQISTPASSVEEPLEEVDANLKLEKVACTSGDSCVCAKALRQKGCQKGEKIVVLVPKYVQKREVYKYANWNQALRQKGCQNSHPC